MIDSLLDTRKAVAKIVEDYREMQEVHGRPAPLRGFAAALCETLTPMGGAISHQSVKNWADGAHLPKTFPLIQIANNAPNGWQRDFAHDMLAVLLPGRFRPATAIGQRALENMRAKQCT